MTEIDLSGIHPTNGPSPLPPLDLSGINPTNPVDNPTDSGLGRIPNTVTNPSAEGESGGNTSIVTSSGDDSKAAISASYNLHYLLIWAAFTVGLVLLSKIMPKISIGIAMMVLASAIITVQRVR